MTGKKQKNSMAVHKPITNTKTLALLANTIRVDLLKALEKAASGHPGGSLGMADIFTILYFWAAKHDPKKPLWDKRDRIVLSNGHICPILYTTLAHAGYFPLRKLDTLRKINSVVQGHPHRGALPGLETTSGPLGSGVSQASGMALAAKMNKQKHTVFVLTSDGEHQEGNTWEGVMLAAKYKLDNLIQIIDYNNIQIDGRVPDIMPLEPFKKKYQAFNWNVLEVNGHNYKEIMSAIRTARAEKKRPTIIIANTVPGKGVSYMENEYGWHGKTPDAAQLKEALSDLAQVRAQIEAGTYNY